MRFLDFGPAISKIYGLIFPSAGSHIASLVITYLSCSRTSVRIDVLSVRINFTTDGTYKKRGTIETPLLQLDVYFALSQKHLKLLTTNLYIRLRIRIKIQVFFLQYISHLINNINCLLISWKKIIIKKNPLL